MKIKKCSQFIFEAAEKTQSIPAESLISSLFSEIKKKFEKMFSGFEVEDGEVRKFGEAETADESEVLLGYKLESLENSKSLTEPNMKLIFSDENFRYDLVISVNLGEGVKNSKEDLSKDDIKKCILKLKKYDIFSEDDQNSLVDQISESCDPKDINAEKLKELIGKMDEVEFEIVQKEEGEE